MYKRLLQVGMIVLGSSCIVAFCWPLLHDTIFNAYIEKQIEKAGGIDTLFLETDSIFALVQQGAVVQKVLELPWPALRKLGLLDIRRETNNMPARVRLYRGGHFDKYYIRFCSHHIESDCSCNEGYAVFKNVCIVGKKVWSFNWGK